MSESKWKSKGGLFMMKAPATLKAKLDETRIERIKNCTDKKQKSYPEMLDAMSRYAPLWDTMKKAKFLGDNQ